MHLIARGGGGGGLAGTERTPGLLFLADDLGLNVAKQQEKLGTATAEQLPGKASFYGGTHRKRNAHAHMRRGAVGTKYIDTHVYRVACVCYKRAHLREHTHTYRRANCQRRRLERERESGALPSPLPSCSGCLAANLLPPRPATLKSKCQPVTFKASDLKMLSSIHLRR